MSATVSLAYCGMRRRCLLRARGARLGLARRRSAPPIAGHLLLLRDDRHAVAGIHAASPRLLAYQAGGRADLPAHPRAACSFILLTGMWEEAMVSVQLAAVGVLLSFLLGAGLGVWAALERPRVGACCGRSATRCRPCRSSSS